MRTCANTMRRNASPTRARALEHGLRERTVSCTGARLAQRHEGADDHADQNVCERAPEIGADAAQIARMLAQPADRCVCRSSSALAGSFSTSHGGSAWREPSRISASCLHQRGQAAHIGAQHGDDAEDDQRDQRTTITVSTVTASTLLQLVAHAPDAQPRRQDVHQLVDQQAGQQRRQQMQLQHQRAVRARRGSRRRSRSAWRAGIAACGP